MNIFGSMSKEQGDKLKSNVNETKAVLKALPTDAAAADVVKEDTENPFHLNKHL